MNINFCFIDTCRLSGTSYVRLNIVRNKVKFVLKAILHLLRTNDVWINSGCIWTWWDVKDFNYIYIYIIFFCTTERATIKMICSHDPVTSHKHPEKYHNRKNLQAVILSNKSSRLTPYSSNKVNSFVQPMCLKYSLLWTLFCLLFQLNYHMTVHVYFHQFGDICLGRMQISGYYIISIHIFIYFVIMQLWWMNNVCLVILYY